jgi:hypothetical protein
MSVAQLVWFLDMEFTLLGSNSRLYSYLRLIILSMIGGVPFNSEVSIGTQYRAVFT